MDAGSFNQTVSVPVWAWLVLGWLVANVGGKLFDRVMDLVLVKTSGKEAKPHEEDGATPSICQTTCKAQWQLEIAQKNEATKDALGVWLREEFKRLHERIDEMMKNGKKD